MIDKIISCAEKYRVFIMYGIVGALTTLLNIALYYLFAHVWRADYLLATVIAFAFAVLFAFLGNKHLVFNSKTQGRQPFVTELLKFVTMRLLTGGFDVAFMFLTVSLLRQNDMIMKIISNIVVIVCNYIISKLIVFKKNDN